MGFFVEIDYRANTSVKRGDLVNLYDSVGWTTYTAAPDRLEAAVAASLRVVTAWDGNQLVGLARVVGDGLTIAYLQDILVAPTHQRFGVGRELFLRVFKHYADVRQKVLITDDEERHAAFYESVGFTETSKFEFPLRTFVKFD